MTDNKLLLKRGADEDFLADDDPLAELARIAGFDQTPQRGTAPAMRREPAFDLEDELLKELEIYAQAPAVEHDMHGSLPAIAPPVESDSAPEPEPEPEPEPQPVAAPEPSRAPVILEAVETYSETDDGRVYERPASHPVFDLEDEILREFAAFDARKVEPRVEQAVAAEIVHQDTADLSTVPVELHDAPDIRSSVSGAHSQGRAIYDSFLEDDLDAAITTAADPNASEQDEPVLAVEAELPAGEPESSVAQDSPAESREYPNAAAEAVVDTVNPEWRAEPTAVEAEPELDPVEHVEARIEPDAENPAGHAGADEPASFIVADVEPMDDELVHQDFADDLPSGQPQVQAEDAASPGDVATQDREFDALLADVERYPVTGNAARWGVQSKPVDVEQVERTAPPVVRDFAPQPAETFEPEEGVREHAAWTEAEPGHDLIFDESDLEIDFGQIELDLADLGQPDFNVSPDLLTEIAGEAVAEPRAAVAEPAIRAPERQGAKTDYSALPFDPSQVVPEDESVEAIAEMDVPDVAVVHEEEPSAAHPEYDIDLDAEMAQLFATATASGTGGQKSGQKSGPSQDNVVAFTPAVAKAPPGALDLDEFERALEEDFRRSFAENRTASHPERVALAPEEPVRAEGRSHRSLALLASAAVAIVLFGGAGVYAYMSGTTKILASSPEPKIILADTDPVKVVPDDPGGKQVPNQNKAVYDRVSGTNIDEAKQETLLTSNEQPVDVVQRTLMPENLPMDDDALAAVTPTGDTVDPRLLPDAAEQERVTTTSKVVSGVSPRKVKTMVVRPDGKLVEREVTEDDLKQQAANDAELMKIAQKAASDAATASDSQDDDIAKTIESVPERLSPADDVAATPDEAADDKTARVTAEPDTAAETAPVDTARMKAAEPTDTAKTIEEAELKPASETAEEKPLERSIAVDADKASEDAIARAADAEVEDAPVRKVKTTKIAPLPENRPVDQPVTVVGTVTDQGTVRSDAKPQDVALADRSTRAETETAPVPAGSYVVQIASLPSEAEAKTSYARLSAKFSGIIGGRGVDIRKAEIKNKGTYYRVRIPAGSKQEAQSLCADYKKAGGSCLVSR